MPNHADTRSPADHQSIAAAQLRTMRQDFADALLAGLTGTAKSIPCRFLYDAKGSELFEDITRQPEYYPTRTEAGILEDCSDDIAAETVDGTVLIEFGSGSSLKTEILLVELHHKLAAYVPLDISEDALDDAVERLSRSFADLKIVPIIGDFSHPISLPDAWKNKPHLGFFPGSTIGNLVPEEAIALLASMRETLGPGARLIIGTDLVKPLEHLIPAYNDAAGVTAAFNLNVLRHANRMLGTDFHLANFRHEAVWNAEKSRIEMHLISTLDQTITGLSQSIRLQEGEHLHTENSHKYTIDCFHDLAAKAGWRASKVWTDDRDFFAVHALEVA